MSLGAVLSSCFTQRMENLCRFCSLLANCLENMSI